MDEPKDMSGNRLIIEEVRAKHHDTALAFIQEFLDVGETVANSGILIEEKPYLDGIPMHVYSITW